MSDQKVAEFLELAEQSVVPANPDLLLQRGRSLRRRRQLAPVVAVAAAAVLGIGFMVMGGDSNSDRQPSQNPTDTVSPRALGEDASSPGEYVMTDVDWDGTYDISVQLSGEGWESWDSGSHQSTSLGAVSWGSARYADTIIQRCNELRRATTMRGAIRQLTHIQGTVTQAPTTTTRLGLTGTHLQLEIPVDVECPGGIEPTMANLMALYAGPTDPTVTVDVWVLEAGDDLVILTKGVRGNPTAEMLQDLDTTFNSLAYTP
jgi:hypothetical protein